MTYRFSENHVPNLHKQKVLCKADQLELILLAQNGDESARQKLILSNVKFVLKLALQFKSKKLTISEKINEGVIGMDKAINRFSLNKDVTFLSYAVWWIKLYIGRAVDAKEHQIHFSDNALKKMKKELKFCSDNNKLSTDTYNNMRMGEDCLSYDDEITSEILRSELIADKNAVSPEHSTKDNNIIRKIVEMSLDKLQPCEKLVLEYRFGLNGKEKISMNEMTKRMKISMNTLRQLREQAINKVRISDQFEYMKEQYQDYKDTEEDI